MKANTLKAIIVIVLAYLYVTTMHTLYNAAQEPKVIINNNYILPVLPSDLGSIEPDAEPQGYEWDGGV